ncbi:MAG TPA: alpha/beta fold hydrolase [Sandaracinaceae bacterium LLY-WYZ-13_1]|nr:alpha/beta fold hydrolase [Sandaracinaceae bacterium LLY-WYZ-13_1]
MRARAASALLGLAILGGACSEAEQAPAEAFDPPSVAPPTPTEPEPARADEPEAPAEPPPLAAPETITVTSEDGVRIVGDLRRGEGPEAPLAVLVHQLGSARAEWAPLSRRLGALGVATFAFDVRGHGESTARAGGAEVDWQRFDTEGWEAVAGDVRAVLGHLREEAGLQPRRVALVGSSIGSSAAILAAAEAPDVDAVVALSPGRAYRGVDALSPLSELGERPLLAVASRGEPPSADTAEAMARIAPAGEARLVEGDRHGVGMFEADPESLDAVLTFLRTQLSPDRGP